MREVHGRKRPIVVSLVKQLRPFGFHETSICGDIVVSAGRDWITRFLSFTITIAVFLIYSSVLKPGDTLGNIAYDVFLQTTFNIGA